MKKVIIVGSKGQDGQLLHKHLKERNSSIISIDVDYTRCTNTTWDETVDISNQNHVTNLIKQFQPHQVYYLAAYHQSSEDDTGIPLQHITNSYSVNVFSYLNFLESIRLFSKKTRIFYAASSHIFGNPEEPIQDETTRFDPRSIYSITKLDSLLLSRYYRENYSIFSSVGILYNHESPLRSEKFVTKKIVKTAVEIKKGEKQGLILGDINALIDWGYAGDYVLAMVKILEHSKADDFIIASGKKAELKDFITIVFENLDLNWKEYVKEDPSLLKRKSMNVLCGNPQKLIDLTGWKPKVSLEELAYLMVDSEIKKNEI